MRNISSTIINHKNRNRHLLYGGSVNTAAGSSVNINNSGGGESSGSSSEGTLQNDIIVNSNDVGYIKKNDVVASGQTWEQILRNMLYRPVGAELRGVISTSTDVEYGSSKGKIDYTATRNGQGPMTEAFYDDAKGNTLEFSVEESGSQKAVRQLIGTYTVRETYEATVVYGASADGQLPEKTLTNTISVNVRRKWFAGVVEVKPKESNEVRALSSSGLYTGAGSYKFSIGKWKTFVICIPEGTINKLTLTAYPGNFIEDTGVCSGPEPIDVNGANGSAVQSYKMWVIVSDGIHDADTFTFETN